MSQVRVLPLPPFSTDQNMISITIDRSPVTDKLDHLYTRLTFDDGTLHINSASFSSELKHPPEEAVEQVCYWLSQKLRSTT